MSRRVQPAASIVFALACALVPGGVVAQETVEPTTVEPTTVEPTTVEPTTEEPVSVEPTTVEPVSVEPTTAEPTTEAPVSEEPTTAEPTTAEPNGPPPPGVDVSTSAWAAWTGFVDKEIERLVEQDPWGSTFTLPKGYMKFKYEWSKLTADSRYDNKGKKGPIVPLIEFGEGNAKQLSIDLGLHGKGGGHTFQFLYGITDSLDWYGELPYSYMNVQIDPDVRPIDAQGNRVGALAAGLLGVDDPKTYGPANVLYETLPKLGRPSPKTEFDGEWILGDINTGLTWNYFRSRWMSAAGTGRIFLPTARVPPANQDLFYGTGPELQVGVGSFGTGFTQIYDVRLLRFGGVEVFATGELTATYYFPQKRDYPTNFVKPHPVAAGLDPVAFPDLTHLKGQFDYEPGWSTGLSGQLQASYLIFGAGVGYGYSYNQEPRIEADPAFVGMVDTLELLGAQSQQMLEFAGSVTLLPFYIPARVVVKYRKPIGGSNFIIFDDWLLVSIEMVAPVYVLWD